MTKNSGLLKGCSSHNPAINTDYQKMAEKQALSGEVRCVSNGVAKYNGFQNKEQWSANGVLES